MQFLISCHLLVLYKLLQQEFSLQDVLQQDALQQEFSLQDALLRLHDLIELLFRESLHILVVLWLIILHR